MSNEDELAEAAILLAYADGPPLPAALERKILTQSQAIASEVRFSTTKSAAVVVEAPVFVLPPRASILRTWGGWALAAACFAVAVYAWRLHAIEHDASRLAATTTPAEASVVLDDGSAHRVGLVRWNRDARTSALVVADLPANAPNEQYRLWLSSTDETHAVPVGALTCEKACAARELALSGPLPVDPIVSAWLTREATGEIVAVPLRPRIVAEGHREHP